ncbi:MAG: AMP-binding protein [Desulfobacteraceae bacterium]|nr:AMP-binding protein [Desulfobacteraceae bacterium]
MSEKQEKIYKSVCRTCHGGCAAMLSVKDGRLAKVRPAPDSPFNRGQMCIKGLATPEMMYHPSRILTPLKRVGDRGANQWKATDWDTALNEIAEKLDRIRQASGPESIAVGQGTGRHHFMHVIRFANTLGTPNWYEPGYANCLLPRITVSNLTYGGFVTADYYGDVLPKTILFWGHNPLVSGPDGELSFPVKHALDAGSFGIAVDPRRSETVRRCKMWLPIRPGTDAALALAMIHVIIHEEIFDKNFVEKWTSGFQELKSHVSGFTPRWAGEITGIPPQDIVGAARQYALEKPSVIEWGVAVEQTPNSLQTVRAIALLRGLTGNIDVPGADILGMNILRTYPLMRDKLPIETARKRIGGENFKFLSGSMAMLPSAHIPGIFRAMGTGNPYPINALLNFGSNPLSTVANAKKVYESLLKLKLLVVADMFMTPTAALADYVLPASFWPEVNQILELPFVAENAVFAQHKVVQTGLCRQDEEIMTDLARCLNLPGADETLEDILNYRLEPLGLNFEELKEKFMVFPPHEYRKFEKSGFHTSSGKVELYAGILKISGYDPLPNYEEPPESPVSRPDTAKDFPYILITGARNRGYFHSEHRQIASLRKHRPDPLAHIHPDAAASQDISDGEWIYVRSPRGKIRMKAALTPDIRKDTVNIDHGWWFPEEEGTGFGIWKSNANLLTSDAPPYDPAFGTYQLRALLCGIEKIENNKNYSAESFNSLSSARKEELNIAENLERCRRLFPGRTALIFEGKTFTYQELDEMSSRVADGLSKSGFVPGDRIALFLPNIPEFVTAYFAVQKLGAVAVLMNPMLKPQEAAFIIRDSGSSAVLTTADLRHCLHGSDLPGLKHIFIADGDAQDCMSLPHLMSGASPVFKTVMRAGDDPSAILYTSGTTGFPKGAVISHRNIIFDARTTAYMFRLSPEDRILLFSPLSHSFTLGAGLSTCINAGASLVLHRDFDPETVLCSVAEHNVTCFYGSTPVYTVLLGKASPEQMSSVRFYISGGAAMPSDLAENWQEKFGRHISISYGLTECSQCCFNHFLKHRTGSVGSPAEGVEIKIADENLSEADPGKPGQLLVRGPKVTPGYWNRPAETAEAIRDGWFHTGDIGCMDEDGYIFITDRQKDMVNVGGQSMYPSEAEAVLCRHPAVSEASVYGIPEPVLGEQVCASIVLKPGEKAAEKEIITFCREHLSDFKIPGRIEFAEALPKAKSGKILKRELREQAEKVSRSGQNDKRISAARYMTPELIKNWITEWLSQIFGSDSGPVQTDRTFPEYGLSSVLMVNLMQDLSRRSGCPADPVLPWHYPTADLLADYLAELWNKPSQSEDSEIQAASRNRDFPLSLAQEELWFYHKRSADAYRIWSTPLRYPITGKLDAGILEQSLNDLVMRHEILRAVFPEKNGRPVQKVVPELRVSLQICDISDMPEQEKAGETERQIRLETQQPLDIVAGPVWRVKLIRLSEKSHILLVYIHHILMDAASMEIFLRELFAFYEARISGVPSALPPLRIQYADFALWQRQFFTQDRLKKRLEYYRNLLNPEPPRLELPGDSPRTSAKTGPGDIEKFQVSPELAQGLESLGQQTGATLFITIFAGFAALLCRYTGCEDIVTGVPMSRRYKEGTEPLIGYFSGQGIIRTDIGGNPAFAELLKRVRGTVQTAIKNQDITYGQVLNALQEENHDAFLYNLPYRAGLNFLPVSGTRIEISGICAESVHEISGNMALDLVLYLWKETDAAGSFLKGYFNFRSDLFESTTIVQMIQNFKTLLTAVVRDPEQPVGSIALTL